MPTFFVAGNPAPQGSKSAYAVRDKDGTPTGQINQTESSKAVKPWRSAVANAAKAHTREFGPIDGAAVVSIQFLIARPKAHYRTGRNAHLLKEGAPEHHTYKPDIDKLVRSTLDGLTTGRSYADDSAVVHLSDVRKLWASRDQRAGAFITVEQAP